MNGQWEDFQWDKYQLGQAPGHPWDTNKPEPAPNTEWYDYKDDFYSTWQDWQKQNLRDKKYGQSFYMYPEYTGQQYNASSDWGDTVYKNPFLPSNQPVPHSMERF